MRGIVMARMSTAKNAHEEIKATDPHTAVTIRSIRQLINQEIIPVTLVGRKKLINIDTLFDYYEHPDKYKNSELVGYGRIRAIR